MRNPLLFVVLLALLTATTANASTATYRMTIVNDWTESAHPIGYPDDAHFSWFGGGTHASPERFWGLGETSTPGFELLAESGNTELWVSEIEAAGGSPLEWRHWFCPPQQTHSNCGPLSVVFEVNTERPFLSLASMLGPSPDWFVGVHDLPLNVDGAWETSLTLPLYLYDAGTESGFTPTIENPPNSEVMHLIAYDATTGRYEPSDTPYQLGVMRLELLSTTSAETSRPTLISATSQGAGGNGTSWDPAVSADGLTIAFSSDATNLAGADPNGAIRDIFVLDRRTGELRNVTAGSNGPSEDPVLSKDGQWLAFVSRATNLPTNNPDTNGVIDDVVLMDLATGEMTLATPGGNAPSSSPSLSANGRRLVFDTYATNLAGNNTQPFGCSPMPIGEQQRCYKHVILFDRVSAQRLILPRAG